MKTRLALALLAAAAGVTSCSRCGSAPGGTSSGTAPVASVAEAPSGSASAAPAPAGPDLPDFPEVKDTGTGRATAALRAALGAYGIAFDAAKLEKECDVDDDGASIDDLEDVANDTYGLDAQQIVLPREHVLLPASQAVPGIVIVESPDDTLDFVLVWKVEGDRALVMDPVQGKGWVPKADLYRRIHVLETTLAAEDWHAVETDPHYQEAVRARLVALGADADKAKALVDRAAGDPGSRALGTLDAATRQLEADASPAAGNPLGFLTKAVDCALTAGCADPVPASFRTARPGPADADGVPQVVVRGTAMLAIAGRRPPAPPP